MAVRASCPVLSLGLAVAGLWSTHELHAALDLILEISVPVETSLEGPFKVIFK